MAHVAEYKKKIVHDFVNLVKKYSIVAVVNMENMPAPQLQKMRQNIRDSTVLLMSKKRLMAIAFDKAKEAKTGIDALKDHLVGMPALIFTNENPFKLYKKLSESKSEAPAKAGQIAPKDIIVSAGPTSFAPGPIIGELGQAGIKAGIDAGKVVIKQDSIVCKKGDKITRKQADVLTRFGIKPMEIGLDLVAAYENGTIYGKEILSVDEKAYMANLGKAGAWAINLAVEIGYTTKDTIEIMLGKAWRDAKAIGLSQGIIADALVEELLAKAEREMHALKSHFPPV
jgi:large subunit ribosomal protein L10